MCFFFFFQAEDGIRDFHVTGVQTCALPISDGPASPPASRPARTSRTLRDASAGARYGAPRRRSRNTGDATRNVRTSWTPVERGAVNTSAHGRDTAVTGPKPRSNDRVAAAPAPRGKLAAPASIVRAVPRDIRSIPPMTSVIVRAPG